MMTVSTAGGGAVSSDMVSLIPSCCCVKWRRIVFNILISNTDDHLRNHGFLYESARGWRLSPAYDLNPVPVDVKARVLSTAITMDDATASLSLALEVAAGEQVAVEVCDQRADVT